MDVIDPYGLPGFPGDGTLPGWIDHADITLRNVRVFTRGSETVTLIQHLGLWDLIYSDGAGRVMRRTRPEKGRTPAARTTRMPR